MSLPLASSIASPATPPLDSGQRATLSQADSGTMLNVKAGATITIQLAAAPHLRWSSPRSSAAAIVAVISTTQGGDGSASAVLRSVAPGTAELTATDDPVCGSCGLPSQVWRVTVVVTPHPVP